MFVIITQSLFFLVCVVFNVDCVFAWYFVLVILLFYADVVVMELRDFNSYHLYTLRAPIKQLQTRNI